MGVRRPMTETVGPVKEGPKAKTTRKLSMAGLLFEPWQSPSLASGAVNRKPGQGSIQGRTVPSTARQRPSGLRNPWARTGYVRGTSTKNSALTRSRIWLTEIRSRSIGGSRTSASRPARGVKPQRRQGRSLDQPGHRVAVVGSRPQRGDQAQIIRSGVGTATAFAG